MDSRQVKKLIIKIEEIQALMVAYVTDSRTADQPSRYRQLYNDVHFALEDSGYENPNPHRTLDIFWFFCKSKIGTWAERRSYVDELYSDILLNLKGILRKQKDPKNWKKTNEILTDELSPVRTQWLKAKTFILSSSPDYENSIKESINSIESTLKILLNQPSRTLGKLIKKISLDTDIAKLISQSYGLISNKDFVRHGGVERQNIGKAEAEFFLEFSAIAINYIVDILKYKKP